MPKKHIPQEEKTGWLKALEELALAPCEKENRPFIAGVGVEAQIAVLMRPSCKCWSCGACAARNARKWIARVINHINSVDLIHGWKFCTITAHPSWHVTPEASVKNLRQGWKKLYNRMRYEFGTTSYVKVWESHKSGAFHMHFLMDTPMSQDWLSDNSASCGMGWKVDVSPVLNAGMVAGYIAKYFTKSEVIGQYPQNMRRIEVSRDWLKLPDLSSNIDLMWLIGNSREWQMRIGQHYFMRGFEVTDLLKDDD